MHHAGHHHYHAIRLSELKRLYWAHTIKQLASSMTLIFVPIYLYNLHYSLQDILWYFLFANIVWFIFLYPCMKLSNIIGANKAMGISLILQSIEALLLATLSIFHWPLWLLAIILASAWIFYWPNFRGCFAKSLLHKKIGQAVGISSALTTFAYGIAPAIGGAIASGFGIVILYVISIALFAFAALPLFGSKEIIQNDFFNLKDLNLRKIRRDLMANISDNIDDSILSIVWPLFIFLLIPSYIGVGILSSISVIAGIVIALYVGKRGHVKVIRTYLKRGTLLTSTTNGIRLLAQSATQIAGVNFINGLGHALMATPFNARYYENANKEPLLPYIFAMMMAAGIANILLFAILLCISFFAPIQIVLLVGLLMAIPAGYMIRLIR